MQTSTIRYRVADFLKEFPPFQLLAYEDLLELAAAGRVRFHADGEIIFDQATARKPYIWVIQQGSVRLYEEITAAKRFATSWAKENCWESAASPAETYLSAPAPSVISCSTLFAPKCSPDRRATSGFRELRKARYSVRPGSDGELAQRSGPPRCWPASRRNVC
jgi:hypothetical protein